MAKVEILAGALLAAAAWGQTAAPATKAHAAVTVMQRGGTYLGVGVADIEPDRAEALKLKDDHGAEVTSVDPEGPAAKAGVKSSDVILEFNGQAVQGIEHLQRMVHETPAGRQVKILLSRKGAPMTVTATLEARKTMTFEIPDNWNELAGSMPIPPMPAMPPIDFPHVFTTTQSGYLGIECEALNQEPQFAEFFGVKDGVLVKAVSRNSTAERAGVKVGDVIVKIGDEHIGSSRDFTNALRNNRMKRTFPLLVVRNKKELALTVTVDEQTGSNGKLEDGETPAG